MSELGLDENVANRMGLPSAIMAAAIKDGDEQIELAVLPPNADLPIPCWSVVIHFCCDPDRPDLGTSSVVDCDGREEAIEHYSERLAALREELDANNFNSRMRP